MNTENLIFELASDLRPVARGAAAWRVAGALLAGGFVALLAIASLLGPPLQAVAHTGAMVFAVKLAYVVAMTALAANLALLSGRPGRCVGIRCAWLLVPPLVVAAAAAMQLAGAGEAERTALIMGTTWQSCLTGVALMSIPVFAALLWAFRKLAPTDLRQSGFLAGLAAGATASSVYALYCPETAAPFLLVWYSLGMIVPAAVGMMLGPRLLRW